MTELTFARLREQNLPRCKRWHPEGAPPWALDDWLLAMGGEVGEALNVVKKLNRDRDGLVGNTRSRIELVESLGAELADAVIYLDICVGWDFPDRPVFLETDFDDVRDDTEFAVRTYSSAAKSPSQLGNWLFKRAGLDPDDNEDGRAFWARQVYRAADGLACHFGIDLKAAVVAKFNATSERFGFPERL